MELIEKARIPINADVGNRLFRFLEKEQSSWELLKIHPHQLIMMMIAVLQR